MFFWRISFAAALSVIIASILTGCSSPQTITVEPWLTLISRLENSWNNRDISLMEECYRDDFQHHLLEEDWDDYDGDGIIDEYWGLDLELAFAQAYFNDADSIYFDLSSGSAADSIWSGDSTGASMAMHRDLVKEIYAPGDTVIEAHPVLLIARPDGDNDWYVWQWMDEE